MDGYFTVFSPLPGVYHIKEKMGVCCTLLVGSERALLYDTGYGIGDLRACVRELTALPLVVVLSHGHHDHALGAAQFQRVRLRPEEEELYSLSSSRATRARVLTGARAQDALPDLFAEEEYLTQARADTLPLEPGAISLGGMTAEIILQPGHTRGSVAVFVRERELLLLGDNWNPETWMFFPFSVPIMAYKRELQKALPLKFSHVLVSHDHALRSRERFESYVAGITQACLKGAVSAGTNAYIGKEVYACYPEPESKLVFDKERLEEA